MWNVFVWSVLSPRTPLDLPNFNLNYEKNRFCEKLDFPRFTNRSVVGFFRVESSSGIFVCDPRLGELVF